MENLCFKNIISISTHGRIMKCISCNKYHIEFNNLLFSFSENEYNKFRNYFLEFDVDYWEDRNKDVVYQRKIIVPVGHKNISTLFNKEEIIELKQLFSNKKQMHQHVSRDLFSTLMLSICQN
jgi:hypothetical protein